MELKYFKDPEKGHCLSFEFEGVTYMTAHKDYFPPAHAALFWIMDTVSQDLINQYYKLSEQYNQWDPFEEDLNE